MEVTTFLFVSKNYQTEIEATEGTHLAEIAARDVVYFT